MDVHHSKVATNQTQNIEHRFCHPVSGSSTNVAQCPIKLANLVNLLAEAPRLLWAWTMEGLTIDRSISWIIKTHSQRTREHLVPIGSPVTHVGTSDESCTHSNLVTREHPKPIRASVNPMEHPREPNKVNLRQPTSAPGTAECPSVGQSVRWP